MRAVAAHPAADRRRRGPRDGRRRSRSSPPTCAPPRRRSPPRWSTPGPRRARPAPRTRGVRLLARSARRRLADARHASLAAEERALDALPSGCRRSRPSASARACCSTARRGSSADALDGDRARGSRPLSRRGSTRRSRTRSRIAPRSSSTRSGASLAALSPYATLERGYAIVRDGGWPRRHRGALAGRRRPPSTSCSRRARCTSGSSTCETRARDRPDPAARRGRPRRPRRAPRTEIASLPFDRALDELRDVVVRLEDGRPAARGVDRPLRARGRAPRALRPAPRRGRAAGPAPRGRGRRLDADARPAPRRRG